MERRFARGCRGWTASARRWTRQPCPSSSATWRPRGCRGEFSLVFLVFNAIAHLQTQAEQVQCFRNAAEHLAPSGRFVIELWVPELRALPPGRTASVGRVDDGYILLDTYDTVTQHVVSHHFRFGAASDAQLVRSPHRYIWPAELDLMAQLAGLELESRHADWVGTEFAADSPSHVSVYRLPS